MVKKEVLIARERSPRLLAFFEKFTRVMSGFVATITQNVMYKIPGFVKGLDTEGISSKLVDMIANCHRYIVATDFS
jgi:hypothetical protein